MRDVAPPASAPAFRSVIGKFMIKPYTAVGLVPTIRGIRSRQDIKINLDHRVGFRQELINEGVFRQELS